LFTTVYRRTDSNSLPHFGTAARVIKLEKKNHRSIKEELMSSAASTIMLPNELILEVISWLPVKHLMQFRCANKFFNTLLSDPYFVQMHLKKSSRNPHLALMWQHNPSFRDCRFITFPISSLIQSDPNHTTLHDNPYHGFDENYQRWWVVGSCNGLLCLIDIHCSGSYDSLFFWNPATRTYSRRISISLPSNFKFAFGYDNSTETYKVVAFRGYIEGDIVRSVVNIFSLGNEHSRNIQCFPVIPLYWIYGDKNNGVHLNGTISWLALHDYFDSNYDFCWKDGSVTVEKYVIVSLDLSSETYTQLLLPRGFEEVPRYQPTLVVLMDCLCFSYDFKGTHFVIWKMKNFGVHESWIQLFNISYQSFFSCYCDYAMVEKFKGLDLLPLYLSENGDTLILVNDEDEVTFIYNCRDKRVEKIEVDNSILWSWAKDYVESLVSIH